jgi:hypothetical protein
MAKSPTYCLPCGLIGIPELAARQVDGDPYCYPHLIAAGYESGAGQAIMQPDPPAPVNKLATGIRRRKTASPRPEHKVRMAKDPKPATPRPPRATGPRQKKSRAKTNRPRKVCELCHADWQPQYRQEVKSTVCRGCRDELRKKHLREKWASRHVLKNYPVRVCDWCCRTYKPVRRDQRYCKRRCSMDGKNANDPRLKRNRPEATEYAHTQEHETLDAR